MALRRPTAAPDPARWSTDAAPLAQQWARYSCELVTPLYGGGVVAGEIDTAMPVRASAIRGQLRFWWRLLAKHKWKLGSAREIRTAEFALWGGIAESVQSSRVWLRVSDIQSPDEPETCVEYDDRSRPAWKGWAHSYALFPAQGQIERGQVKKAPAQLLKPGASWTLELGFDTRCTENDRNQALEALRWWASFGGLGARTRRGLGAVKVADVVPVTADEAITAGARLVTQGSPCDAQKAWHGAVSALQSFRQGVEVGRNRGEQPNRPGRSRWPEPPAIRKASRSFRVKSDGVSFEPPADTPLAFPRAAFGMPIVFHFQGTRDDTRHDPADAILEPAPNGHTKRERLASPIILRPIQAEDGKWLAGALLLPERPGLNDEVALNQKGRQIATGKIFPEGLKTPHLHGGNPMQGRSDDPLTAFLDFFADSRNRGNNR